MNVTTAKEIGIDTIVVEGNFRQHFDEDALKELAGSIATHGVQDPIWVRVEDGKTILIAGERRLRASRMAGKQSIPYIVKDVDARGAAELQLLENIHREDLGPIEEARAFKALLDSGKHTAESLSDSVDKSTAYVYRALRLLELPGGILEAIAEGKLTPSHGHQILRVPFDQMVEVCEFILRRIEDGGTITVSELSRIIDYKYGSYLASALFPKGKAFAGEIACSGCSFNSGNQGQLFDGATKGRCNYPDCFKKKTGAVIEQYSKTQAGEHPGLQYLGVQSVGLGGEIEGVKVVGAVTPAVKKLMKENPDKFGWAVVAPRGPGDKLTTTVVCLDKRLGDVPPATRSRRDEADTTGNASNEKELFIEEKVTEAFNRAIADTVEPRKRFDFTTEQWAAIFGAPASGVSDQANAQALLVQAVMSAADRFAAMEAIGLKPAKIEIQARKEAASAWEKQEASK